MLEFSIATITLFVNAFNEFVKFLFSTYFRVDVKKYIPLVSICAGIILGIIGFYLPNVEMGNSIVEAIFIGMASGAAATGVHQVGKQLSIKPVTDETYIPPFEEPVRKEEPYNEESKSYEEF